MKIRKPSPAMVVAVIALFMATSGSAVAVVSFARNAGAVDGKSAVSAGASNRFAAGKLVATNRRGTNAGKLPSRFLDSAVPRASVFGRTADVIDNGSETPFTIASAPGFGVLSATCSDESTVVGREDPRTTISFGNTSGQPMEFSRSTGNGTVGVTILAPSQSTSFALGGSNTFTVQVQKLGTNVILEGVVRQDGRGSNNARCINYGRVTGVQ